MITLPQHPNSLLFPVSAELYSEAVVFKCFYWYGNLYTVTIEKSAEHGYLVALTPKQGEMTPKLAEALSAKIKTDLIDFKTREIVARETETIRSILLAKAFASGPEFENPPCGEISDPVGFEADAYD